MELKPSLLFITLILPTSLAFDGGASKIVGFVIACKLYIKMKIRKVLVEKQMQWVLTYMQGGLADTWEKRNLVVGMTNWQRQWSWRGNQATFTTASKRQEMKQVPIGPALMKKVVRTNVVIVNPQQQ